MTSRATTIVTLTSNEPPRAFRICTAGKVETLKGDFIFDTVAAQSVMTAYRRHGVELMVDYDHAALGGSFADPALAGRAAGWFAPEVRNGELWASNVRWTPAADAALRAKEWLYMSPAFNFDPKTKRFTELISVALTNLPASRNLEPLMAASSRDVGFEAIAMASLTAEQQRLCKEMKCTATDFIAARAFHRGARG